MNDYSSTSLLYFFDRVLILSGTFIGSTILFLKFSNHHVTRKSQIIILILNIIAPVSCHLLGGADSIIIKLLYYLFIGVSLVLIGKNDLYKSIPITIISIAISLSVQYTSLFIVGSFLFLISFVEYKLFSTVIVDCMHIIICLLLSKNKKLNNCFIYLTNESRFGVGILIASYIFSFSLLLTQLNSFSPLLAIILIAICPLAFTGLILWIRNIVNNYFKKRIADRADEFTKKEIEEKDARIEQLEAEVATLSKQLHRDNHLLSSLDRSAQALSECETDADRERIIGEIHTMYSERNALITKEQQKNNTLPSTGIAIIDASLSDLYTKAAAHGIEFDLIVGEKVYYLVNNTISQTDFQTLLCDHVKDAIIAVQTVENISGKILVNIEKNEGIFEITISDNGVAFDAETLAKLGKERITTHADNGGSGIGFMTTFETLRKTKGSLIIAEFDHKTPFTKSISFVFDGLHQFIISSYRSEELQRSIQRDDIIFF